MKYRVIVSPKYNIQPLCKGKFAAKPMPVEVGQYETRFAALRDIDARITMLYPDCVVRIEEIEK